MDTIKNYLHEIEKTHGITILLAVESGSRIWGFPSLVSDYDIRFIYVRSVYQHVTTYTAIPDTITCDFKKAVDGNDLDIHGWDLRKACNLARTSNASLLEWMNSPIVYINRDDFSSKWLVCIDKCINPKRLMYHYRGQAEKLLNSMVPCTIKRYLYVIRCVLCAYYVQQHNTPPPISLHDFKDSEPYYQLEPHISSLIAARAQSTNEQQPTVQDLKLSSQLLTLLDALDEDKVKDPPKDADTLFLLENFYKDTVYLYDVPF